MVEYLGVGNIEKQCPYKHDRVSKIGVLVTNLGTPDAPTAAAVRPYLREFLSDPRVIELPWLYWQIILNLFVLTFRPKKSAKLYESVWTKDGSPLFSISKRQKQKLQARLEQRFGKTVVIALGMRYGNPSIESALQELHENFIEKLIVIPLYPQYSATTSGSTFDAVADALKKWRRVPDLRFISQFADHPHYLDAVVEKIQATAAAKGRPEKLLFSFHGIPKRYFTGGDMYHCHCQKTARLIAERLGLSREQYLVTFQSLFGKEEWVKPYTDKTIQALAESGTKKLHVVCPGFTADCLETLEEINEQNREIFLHHGGEQFEYIEAVNDSERFIDCLEDVVLQNLSGWCDLSLPASVIEAQHAAAGSELAKRVAAFERQL